MTTELLMPAVSRCATAARSAVDCYRTFRGVLFAYPHSQNTATRQILRAEVQNIGNHNNIGPLDSTVNDIGNGNYLNRKNATEDPGRIMVLWAKIAF